MRYSQIRSMDISNGEGLGVALFIQGCPHHCKNCFNPETWDFNGGKEWTEEVKNEFFKLIDRPYIKRVSLLGGSPLADQNLDDVLSLVKEIKAKFPNKSIWLYTGYRYEECILGLGELVHNHNHNRFRRQCILKKCDVLVDGKYIDELRDISLHWRGSSNQRVIDVQQSLEKGEIILWSS